MNSGAHSAVLVPPPSTLTYPGSETPINTPYGIQSILPAFERDHESDFALLKMALDNVMDTHGHLTEQYKYCPASLPSALHLAKAYCIYIYMTLSLTL